MANKGSFLTANQILSGDDYLESANGQYVALMQDDGNFVLYHVSSSGSFTNPYWSTGTGGIGQGYAIMQNDGNFVLFHGTPSNPGAFYWATDTNETVGASLLSTTIIAGNNQIVARTGSQHPGGVATFAPLQVKVLNPHGQSASGVRVDFTAVNIPPGMAVQFTPNTLGGTFAVTDANGIATLNQMNGNSMQCFNASGWFTIEVNTIGGSQIFFNEAVSS